MSRWIARVASVGIPAVMLALWPPPAGPAGAGTAVAIRTFQFKPSPIGITTFSRVFAEPGTYRYFCARHPSMQGEVRVR
jgi:hypothetical protein